MKTPALQLDFVRQPARPWNRAAWLLLALAALIALLLTAQSQALQQRVDALQARKALPGQRAAATRERKEPALSPADAERRVARANKVIDELAVPWSELFRAFEAADAPGVGLLSLLPNGAEGTIRLGGEAASVPQLLVYVERLVAQPALAQVHLLGYETVERDGRPVITFTVAARWLRS